jgi:hypothetical protein
VNGTLARVKRRHDRSVVDAPRAVAALPLVEDEARERSRLLRQIVRAQRPAVEVDPRRAHAGRIFCGAAAGTQALQEQGPRLRSRPSC